MKFPHFQVLFIWLSLFVRLSLADPSLTNVVASQRSGTKLVDIYYDLLSPNGPCVITVEVSDNGGTTYLVPASTFSGHVGASITTGVGRKITWNAGLDHPGQLSTNMRFRVCANDGYPSDSSYDSSTFEFINRSLANGDAVFATARVQLDLFVRECKRLGFWNAMVYVPCRQGYGALNTLGGAPQRTNAKFQRAGTTNLTVQGVKFNQGNFYVNHLQTPFNWPVADEPVFVGVLGYAETGADTYTTSYYALRYDGGGYLLGSYNSGRGIAGFAVPNAPNLEFFDDNPGRSDTRTLRKPTLMGAQFDGSHTLKSVLGPNYRETPHATAFTGRPTGKVWFMQATDHLTSNVVQGCIMFYGDVGSLPMQSLYSLLGYGLAEAQALEVPADVLAAFLPASLTELYLTRIERGGSLQVSQIRRQIQLWRAARRNRF